MKYIDEICEFLDTTPNYLFWGSADEEKRLTSVERDMIEAYRILDDGRKKCIWDTLMYFKEGCRKRKRSG